MRKFGFVVRFEVSLDGDPNRHVEQSEHRKDGHIDRKLRQLLRMHGVRVQFTHHRMTDLGHILTTLANVAHRDSQMVACKNSKIHSKL